MEFTIGDQQNMGFTGNQTITARFDSTNKLEINSKNNSLKIISQTKCSGIDTENIRKNRDETKVQLRKDKRYERANLQRRKYEVAPKPEETPRFRRPHETEANKQLVLSNDYHKQLEGCVFFRKMLATDKNPPIDVVVESGIIPRFLELLNASDKPEIQFEVAWTLTNVACGETQHIAVLIQNGAIPILVYLLGNCTNTKVREQVLWTLSNISADISECRDILINNNILTPMMAQLGLEDPNPNIILSPSLATMEKLAITCLNLVRGFPSPPFDIIRKVVLILSELIQSPDIETVNNVCLGLHAVCEGGSNNIQLLLEQGLVTKLREICDINDSKKILKDSAIRALSSIAKSPNLIHRKLILSSRLNGCLNLFIMELNTTNIELTQKDICKCLKEILKLSPLYVQNALEIGIMVGLDLMFNKNQYELNQCAGQCLCMLIINGTNDNAVQLIVNYPAMARLNDLLLSTDPDMLHNVLLAIFRIAEISINNQLLINDIRDKINLLTCHPFSKIALIAAKLEDILDRCFYNH